MTAPTPLWFDDPTSYAPACGSSAQAEPQSVDAGVRQPRAGAPECPKCHTAEPPRLVTFDGIDSGTGEQIHEERFRCSCGFVGESEEFQFGAEIIPVGNGDVTNSPARAGSTPAASITHGGYGYVRVGTPGSSPGGSTISPRIERGTEDGSSCPF